MMTGCSDSTTTFDPIKNSNVLNERFGTITSRNAGNDGDTAEVVRAMNDFSFELHRAISEGDPTANSIESGYSAAVALSLAYAGTSGDTQTSLANLLGVDDISESVLHTAVNELALELENRNNNRLTLRTANAAFVPAGLALNNDFLDTATGNYGAPVIEADFSGGNQEVLDDINAWASQNTDGFIPSILDEVSRKAFVMLLNAVYLDAQWQNNYTSSGDGVFMNMDGTTSSIEYFSGEYETNHRYKDNTLVLEIPYAGSELSMLILMPSSTDHSYDSFDPSAANDLSFNNFESTLDAATVEKLMSEMLSSEIEIVIPMWEDELDFDLNTVLSSRGFPANPWMFSRMIEDEIPLKVSAKQTARIEVDEFGTRAAAVTSFGAQAISAKPLLIINQPFVYMIRDRVTGLVLFTGRVVSLGQ